MRRDVGTQGTSHSSEFRAQSDEIVFALIIKQDGKPGAARLDGNARPSVSHTFPAAYSTAKQASHTAHTSEQPVQKPPQFVLKNI